MSEPVEAKTAWILGWEAGASTVTGILTDLIAELREWHFPHECTDPEDFPCCCMACGGKWPCDEAAAADRAEARLREVTSEAPTD